jgi:ribose transport system ATP-binding protein
MTDPERILEMRGIDKTFPGVHALHAVDLDVRVGEILGLVGENGAGKSTLIKILAGAYGRDAGEIRIAGELVDAASPSEMIDRGIAVIYQEPSLAPHLSVAENIFMGRLPTSRLGIVNRRKLAEDTAVVAERLGLDIDPGAPVGTLSVARRQMVEIAKALSRDARLIVLDEPSAVLADAELEGLIRVMHRLAEKGVAFIYISHRLNEVFRITDRVTVMKDGRVVATEPTAAISPDRLVRLMVGRDLGQIFGERPPARWHSRSAGSPAMVSSTTCRSRRAPVRSWGSPGWRAPAGPRCCARSTAPIRWTAGRSRSSDGPSRSARRGRRSR